jgi:hypothetical protein
MVCGTDRNKEYPLGRRHGDQALRCMEDFETPLKFDTYLLGFRCPLHHFNMLLDQEITDWMSLPYVTSYIPMYRSYNWKSKVNMFEAHFRPFCSAHGPLSEVFLWYVHNISLAIADHELAWIQGVVLWRKSIKTRTRPWDRARGPLGVGVGHRGVFSPNQPSGVRSGVSYQKTKPYIHVARDPPPQPQPTRPRKLATSITKFTRDFSLSDEW